MNETRDVLVSCMINMSEPISVCSGLRRQQYTVGSHQLGLNSCCCYTEPISSHRSVNLVRVLTATVLCLYVTYRMVGQSKNR